MKAVGAAALLALGFTGHAANAETRGYVVSWFYMAAASQDNDCPDGFNPTSEAFARNILPIVVAGGSTTQPYYFGQMVPIARTGSEANVAVDGAIAVTDTLVADFAHPGYAIAGDSTTDPKLILGYALGPCSACTPAAPGIVLTRIH
jgi:hypothetical protein